jgi:molybdenum cofactor guanylyltransferase
MTQPLTSPVSCAVLAGGHSRRMGRDKALIKLDGVPLLQRAIETLRSISNDVYVVGDRTPYHQFGAPVYQDTFPEGGALGGIATALLRARFDHVLVVACDMPYLNADLLRALAAEPRDFDALVPVLADEPRAEAGEPRFETLHAIYSKNCLPAILELLDQRKLKIAEFLDTVNVRTIDANWIRRFDPELHSFINANHPDDLNEDALLCKHLRINARAAEGGFGE